MEGHGPTELDYCDRGKVSRKASHEEGPYSPLGLLSLEATFTPLSPPAYFATPLYSDSAIFSRYSGVSSLAASVGLETNEISARMLGMLAPISTTNGAFLTPRSRRVECLLASPL